MRLPAKLPPPNDSGDYWLSYGHRAPAVLACRRGPDRGRYYLWVALAGCHCGGEWLKPWRRGHLPHGVVDCPNIVRAVRNYRRRARRHERRAADA